MYVSDTLFLHYDTGEDNKETPRVSKMSYTVCYPLKFTYFMFKVKRSNIGLPSLRSGDSLMSCFFLL